jgi:hypothetical protein
MHTRKSVLCWLSGVVLVALYSHAALHAQEAESLPLRILKWSQADQVVWLKSYLADGMPVGDELTMLVLNKSSIVLPVLEQEIEDILHSQFPRQLFSNLAADPERVVGLARAMIEYAGDTQSLKEASKLMRLDEHRFANVVYNTLLHAGANRNPFTVAYGGFEIGDPEVDKRIIQWADKWLKLGEDYDHVRAKRSWAEAMVEKYDGVPYGAQWTTDPIVSGLDSSKYAGLHDEMLPLTIAAAQKRSKR